VLSQTISSPVTSSVKCCAGAFALAGETAAAAASTSARSKTSLLSLVSFRHVSWIDLAALRAVGFVCDLSGALGERTLLRTRLLPAPLASAGLTALLYAPVIATSGVGALTRASFVESRSWPEFADRLPSSLSAMFAGWHRDQPAAVWAALALGFVLGLALHGRLARPKLPPRSGRSSSSHPWSCSNAWCRSSASGSS
jgi:hypothetical protein